MKKTIVLLVLLLAAGSAFGQAPEVNRGHDPAAVRMIFQEILDRQAGDAAEAIARDAAIATETTNRQAAVATETADRQAADATMTAAIATNTAHTSASTGVHGLGAGDPVVGAASLTMKLNTDFSNLTATSAARIALNLSNHHLVTVDSAGNASIPATLWANAASISGSIAVNGGIIATGGVSEFNSTASAVRILGNPGVASGSVHGFGGIDVWNPVIVFGSEGGSNARTSITEKYALLLSANYYSESPLVQMVYAYNAGSSGSICSIGGGNANYAATNKIRFYTITNSAIKSAGTRAGSINSSGQWQIGPLEVYATATSCLLRVVGGAEVASMTIGTDTPAAGYQLTVASGAYLTNVLATGTLTIPLVAPADPQPGMIWFEP